MRFPGYLDIIKNGLTPLNVRPRRAFTAIDPFQSGLLTRAQLPYYLEAGRALTTPQTAC